MYEELIKQMRSVYQEVDCPDCPLAKDCMTLQSVCAFTRAADAIEELSMKLHGDEAAISGMQHEIERMVVYGNKPPKEVEV